MSDDPPWVRMGPFRFWHAAWKGAVQDNPRWRDAEADEGFWQEFAADYDTRSPLAECAPALVADLRALVPSGGRLLEIGAGTGAFTRRLAVGLGQVTCVEPSAAMRAAVEAAWPHPDPVTMIASDWQDAPEGLKADLVLCANALYRTADIGEALEKMTMAAAAHVAIVQSVGRPHAGPLQLRENGKLWERERADAIFHAATALGVQVQRKDYRVMRPDGESRVALLYWTV